MVRFLIILLALTASASACPLWTQQVNGTEDCRCGDTLGGVVSCNEETKDISLMFCYCMAYNKFFNETVVGSCLAMCTSRNTPTCLLLNEVPAVNDSSEINDKICNSLKKTGQLCGKCMKGYGIPAYSHSLHCVQCNASDFKHNLAKFLVVAFLPLTVFYSIVVVFKISITSGNMVGYVLICQLLATPTLLRAVTRPENDVSIGTKFMVACFSVWNLDFFRSMYAPFCLHPQLSTLHMLTLDYIIGVYPLFLIVLTYIIVLLHDRYPIVVKIWRPAYKLCMYVRKEWNIRGSLVQAFATFLILSYIKLLNVSFDLLFPVTVTNSKGEILNQTYLFNDAEIIYFGDEHLPYGILAIFMLSVFNILPVVILTIYPCHYFQKILTLCGVRSHALLIFMDVFQGCYRHGPRDCRYFAAVYLIVRILFLLLFLLVRDGTILAIFGCEFIILALIVTFTEPYIKKSHNKIDIFLFLLTGLSFLVGCLDVYMRPGSQLQRPLHYLYVLTVMPTVIVLILYGGAIVTAKTVPQKLIQSVKRFCKTLRCRKKEGMEEGDDHFPYRFEHADEATALLK